MKKLLLIAFLLLAAVSINAQDTITNNGFERWTPSGKQPPFDWEEPQGWTSTNSLTEFIAAGVSKTQYPASGSTQAKLKTINVFGTAIPAFLINGDFPISIDDTAKVPLLGGEPYSTSPKTKLYGMYNFTATDNTDSAMVVVAFKKFNTTTQKPEAVAIGQKVLAPTTTGLFLFSVDINQLTTDMPDSLVITFVSSKAGNFKQGGELIIDLISFDPPLIVQPQIADGALQLYPNPAGNSNVVTITNGNTDFMYELVDITGKTILKGESSLAVAEINTRSIAPGCYYVKVLSDKVQVVKFIKD